MVTHGYPPSQQKLRSAKRCLRFVQDELVKQVANHQACRAWINVVTLTWMCFIRKSKKTTGNGWRPKPVNQNLKQNHIVSWNMFIQLAPAVKPLKCSTQPVGDEQSVFQDSSDRRSTIFRNTHVLRRNLKRPDQTDPSCIHLVPFCNHVMLWRWTGDLLNWG